MARLLFGTHLSNTTPYETARSMARAADGQRWNSLWTYDHLLPPLPSVMPMFAKERHETDDTYCLEGWAFLAALAAETKRVTVGCLVSANTFRNPMVLAKMAATVDVISNGRSVLGLGAAWHEREHKAYGIPFYTTKERQDRMEEAAQFLRMLFRSKGRVSHQGKFYQLDDAPFEPKGARPGGPPIMIGGGGEKRTLRTLALYGDISNIAGPPLEVRRKIQVLEDHCQAVGRDPKEIRNTAGLMTLLTDSDAATKKWRDVLSHSFPAEYVKTLPIGNAQQIIDTFAPYIDAGIEEITCILMENTPEMFERMDSEVLSAFD